MKVLFAGTPDFAVPALKALQDKHEIVGVYTQPDRKSGRGKKVTMPAVKQVALQYDLPIFQPSSLSDQQTLIEQLQPDVFVVVAFGMLLPQNILDIPPLGCINIHGSILPRWRGAAPIQRAIEAGDIETGVSIMRMEAGLDTGPVFQILRTNIDNQDTSQTLHDQLAKLGAQGICETLDDIEQRVSSNQAPIEATPQDDGLATYAKKISKQESQINWLESSELIQRKIRAFNPWPICQTQHAGNRIRLWRSSVVNNKHSTDTVPGQVLASSDQGLVIACGNNHLNQSTSLRLEVLQRDGSKSLECKEFLNGYPIQVGETLD